MPLDGNYSSFNTNNDFYIIQDGLSSRITSTLTEFEYAAGITSGDVIRFDQESRTYVKSKADTSYNAEVYGVVESYDSTTKEILVVLNGSINLVGDKITEISGSDNTGLNDIYFLSASNSGYLQNIPPQTIDAVVKPIYYKAPHDNFTGLVRNYLGYKSPFGSAGYEIYGRLISFSQNMNYSLHYDPIARRFIIFSISYTSGTFTKTIKNIINLPDFSSSVVYANNFNDLNNYDAKISNDGNEILIFSKPYNKIHHINATGTVDNQTVTLKASISVSLPGQPVDKLWACDDELTCMTVSSRALERQPDENVDFAGTSWDVSSKINHYYRSINGQNKYKWKRSAQTHAFSVVRASNYNGILGSRDSLLHTSGIINLYDIKSKGKNFVLSTTGFNENQNLYKSKTNSKLLPRYENINLNNSKISYVELTGINGNNKTTADRKSEGNDFGNNLNQQKYSILPTIKNYNILRKINEKYYEDISHKDLNGVTNKTFPSFAQGLTASIGSVSNNILSQFSSFYSLPGTSDFFRTVTSCAVSENHFIQATLTINYDSNDNIISKNINLLRYPFYSNDQYSVFKYPSFSIDNNSYVPTELYNSNIGPLAISINSSDINSMSSLNCFSSNNRCFLTTNFAIFVFNYSTLTTVKLSNQNFDKAQFYFNASGEFFMLDGNTYKFNSSTNQLDLEIYQ